jgi:hypothetical protein
MSGIEMLKGQFKSRRGARATLRYILPKPEKLAAEDLRAFFFVSCGKSDCYICRHFKNDIGC